jgi:hypothetical protein
MAESPNLEMEFLVHFSPHSFLSCFILFYGSPKEGPQSRRCNIWFVVSKLKYITTASQKYSKRKMKAGATCRDPQDSVASSA